MRGRTERCNNLTLAITQPLKLFIHYLTSFLQLPDTAVQVAVSWRELENEKQKVEKITRVYQHYTMIIWIHYLYLSQFWPKFEVQEMTIREKAIFLYMHTCNIIPLLLMSIV